MNYKETIDYLYTQLPMFSRVGGLAIKPGLNNIIAICESLGNPHQKSKFIHVAGTNGKGSVSHMLASIFQNGGYKTGLYTSPHLKDFRERIKIDGKMVPEKSVIDFVEKIIPITKTLQPSFFEITVAMAFHHFAENNIDIAIIETGLGGRLDSTNIINPLLSVITNIGYDHIQILGNTLEAIAAEKAGIIKHKTPVVIGEKQPETKSIFINKAKEKEAPIFFASDIFQTADWQIDDDLLKVSVAEKGKTDHHNYYLDLNAQYQTKNLLTVLQSCRLINTLGFDIDEHAITTALKNVKKNTGLHGRWETIHHNPKIILDVAHNPSGVQELLNQLEITNYYHLHIILGMVKDKDVDKVLEMLPKNAIYYFTNANIPRALMADELKEKALLHDLNGHSFINVNKAIDEAKSKAHKDDLILVCGSVFLIGEVV